MCFTGLTNESKRGLSMLYDSNSFSMMAHRDNKFIKAQTSFGLTRLAPRALHFSELVKCSLLMRNNDEIGTRKQLGSNDVLYYDLPMIKTMP